MYATTETPVPAPASSTSLSSFYPAMLAVFVLVTRVLCRGPLYFGDGPSMVKSIFDKTYIVQPPGYWLFDRTAGLFSNPVLAMTTMNILFSVAGVVVFYYAACFFASRNSAVVAALAYSCTFYIWFSGEVHSTYASQILFPVATFYMLLRYDRDRAGWNLWLAALLFAVGAGMRPTDGVFLLPMVLYFAAFRMPRKQALQFLALCAVLCLGWVVPTLLAYKNSAYWSLHHRSQEYVGSVVRIQSIVNGIHIYTVANFVRYLLPIFVGFWPILGVALRNTIRKRYDWRMKAIALWIFPGSLFFVVCLISLPPYLNFLTAAILLLAVSAQRRMAITAVWNAIVFLALAPVPSHNLAVNVANSFVLRCTRGGIQQRYNATLSDLQHIDRHE